MNRIRWLIAQQVPNLVLAVWISLISIMILRVTESSSKAARYRFEVSSKVARALAE